MELYSPAFGAAAASVDVHGEPSTEGTMGYMCAYNRINGDWLSRWPPLRVGIPATPPYRKWSTDPVSTPAHKVHGSAGTCSL